MVRGFVFEGLREGLGVWNLWSLGLEVLGLKFWIWRVVFGG
jgi:hypothetical protein